MKPKVESAKPVTNARANRPEPGFLRSVAEILEEKDAYRTYMAKDADHGDELRHIERHRHLPQGVVKPVEFRDEQKEGVAGAPRAGRWNVDTPAGIPGEEMPEVETNGYGAPRRVK